MRHLPGNSSQAHRHPPTHNTSLALTPFPLPPFLLPLPPTHQRASASSTTACASAYASQDSPEDDLLNTSSTTTSMFATASSSSVKAAELVRIKHGTFLPHEDFLFNVVTPLYHVLYVEIQKRRGKHSSAGAKQHSKHGTAHPHTPFFSLPLSFSAHRRADRRESDVRRRQRGLLAEVDA